MLDRWHSQKLKSEDKHRFLLNISTIEINFQFPQISGIKIKTWENTEPAFLITDCSVLHQLQKPRLVSWYYKSLHLMLISKIVSTSLPTSFSEASHPLALGTLQVSLDPVKGSLILDFKLTKNLWSTSSSYVALTFDIVPWRPGWWHRCCHKSKSPPSKYWYLR